MGHYANGYPKRNIQKVNRPVQQQWKEADPTAATAQKQQPDAA
jgi:hypothetical protein